MTDEIKHPSGLWGSESDVACENCQDGRYRRVLGLDEDTEYIGGEHFECPNCGDGKYIAVEYQPVDEELERVATNAYGIERTGEPLAALAHRLWTYWSQHIAEEESISEERLERWERLWIPYEELPKPAKDTDRRLVKKFAEKTPDYNDSLGGSSA